MTDKRFKVNRKDVIEVIRGTFPEYGGRKIAVEVVTGFTVYDLNWSGGTRNQYASCTLDGTRLGDSSRANSVAPWNNSDEGKTLPLPAGALCVKRGIFCGKDTGLVIYVHPQDADHFVALAKE